MGAGCHHYQLGQGWRSDKTHTSKFDFVSGIRTVDSAAGSFSPDPDPWMISGSSLTHSRPPSSSPPTCRVPSGSSDKLLQRCQQWRSLCNRCWSCQSKFWLIAGLQLWQTIERRSPVVKESWQHVESLHLRSEEASMLPSFLFFVFLLMLLFCLTFFSGSLHTVMESTKVKQASKRWKEKRESNLRQEPFYFHPEPDSVNFSPSSMTVSCGQSPSAPLESKYKAMDIRLNHHWRRLLTSQRESN